MWRCCICCINELAIMINWEIFLTSMILTITQRLYSYNMDDTEVPLEPQPSKVIAKRGHNKVCYQTSSKKQQITVIDCMSATRLCILPFIIFTAKQINHLWTRNVVSRSWYAVSEKDRIDHKFVKEHFFGYAVSHQPLSLQETLFQDSEKHEHTLSL